MDAQRFLGEFQYIASSPNGLTNIKNLILELAVRGRLSERKNNESVASEYIKRNIARKKHLIENGEIKKLPTLPHVTLDEAPWSLPDHWVWSRLGDVTNYGSVEKKEFIDVDPDTWVLELEDIEKDTSILLSRVTSKERNFKSTKNVFKKNDVLYGKLRPYLNKVLVADESGVCSTEIIPIRAYYGIESNYLKWVLRSPYFLEYASSSTHGMSLPRLGTHPARMALIPLPPLPEQKRIVAKIEELMALCDQLEKQRSLFAELQTKANLALITNLMQVDTFTDLETSWNKFEANIADLLCTLDNVHVLKETIKTLAVLGKLETYVKKGDSQKIIDESLAQKKKLLASKEVIKQKLLPSLALEEIIYDYPSHWSVTRFDDLANVTGGITKGRRFKGRQTSNYPYLRVANVQRGYFLLDDIQEIEIPVDEYEKYVLEDGDILIAEGGDWDKVGRTAIWQGQLHDCLHQNHIFKARMFSDRIKKEWIELVFNSSVGRQYWASASKQTTNLASINMTQVRSFPVPVPPQEEQQRILYKLNSLLSICDELIEKIKKSQEVQENFSKAVVYSILHKEMGYRVMVKEKLETKRLERQINVDLILASSMVDYLKNTTLAKILKDSDGKMEAKKLWKASKLKVIDDFYALLKQEIEDGFIQEPDIAEVELVEIVE